MEPAPAMRTMSHGDTGPVWKLPGVWTLRDEEEEMDESMQMEQMEGVETTDDPDFETVVLI